MLKKISKIRVGGVKGHFNPNKIRVNFEADHALIGAQFVQKVTSTSVTYAVLPTKSTSFVRACTVFPTLYFFHILTHFHE